MIDCADSAFAASHLGQDFTHAYSHIDAHIRHERPDDGAEIDALYHAVFGPGRFAKTVERLREGNRAFTPGCFIASDSIGICGAVRLWPVASEGAPILMLGPCAVAVRRRGDGIGMALTQIALGAAKASSWGAVFLVGDLAYYSRAGFERLPPQQLSLPGPVDPARVLGLSLLDGGLAQVYGRLWVAKQ